MKLAETGVLRRILIIVLVACAPPMTIFSQEAGSCAEKLQEAQNLFDRGQVEQVPALISDCMKSGFTREEQLSAYKLMIQSLIFEEKLEAADSMMYEFIKTYPEYQVSPTDHSSFVLLFNNYYPKIVIQASFQIGSNMPFLSLGDKVQLPGVPGTKDYSSGLLNLFISGEVKYRLLPKLDINAGFVFSQYSFKNTEPFMDYATRTFTETHRRIELPLSASYDVVKWRKLSAFARLGASPVLTTNAKGTGVLTMLDKNNLYDRSGEDLSLNDRRRFITLQALAGIGIKYKVPEGYVFAELRGNAGLTNMKNKYGYDSEDDELAYFYMAGDDSYRGNVLSLSLGYTMIFYKPQRRGE